MPDVIKATFARFEHFGGRAVARVIVSHADGGTRLVTLYDPPDDLVAGEALTLERGADRKLVLKERRS